MKSRNRITAKVIFVVLVSIVLAGCGGAPESPQIKAEQIWARPSMTMPAMSEESDMGEMEGKQEDSMAKMDTSPATGATGAVFMKLVNDGGQADKLVSAEADVATAVELHKTTMQDGVMKMSPVTAIEVPAKGSVTLKPGDYHIMLLGLTRDLNVGDTFKIKLNFEKSPGMELDVTVREM